MPPLRRLPEASRYAGGDSLKDGKNYRSIGISEDQKLLNNMGANNNQIHAIIGGLHLGSVNPKKLFKICEHLKEFNLNKIIVGHCPGNFAMTELAKTFGDKVEINAVGKTMLF